MGSAASGTAAAAAGGGGGVTAAEDGRQAGRQAKGTGDTYVADEPTSKEEGVTGHTPLAQAYCRKRLPAIYSWVAQEETAGTDLSPDTTVVTMCFITR